MKNKICHLCFSEAVLTIASIVFLSQIMLELSGIIVRKPGFEWVLPSCGGAFAMSLVYYITSWLRRNKLEDM